MLESKMLLDESFKKEEEFENFYNLLMYHK